ncbi:MAG: hypothetical protein ICV73_10280 [Acetobacteraceae bacterium]|nr:hypothetical protein [Acetobacteraceae bacterium]
MPAAARGTRRPLERFSFMLFFAAPAAADPSGLILSAAEAARQRARGLARARLAQDSAFRLIALARRPAAG